MKRFRVIVGVDGEWAHGHYQQAATAQEAVDNERKSQRSIDPTFGGIVSIGRSKPPTVLRVFELVPVEEWK